MAALERCNVDQAGNDRKEQPISISSSMVLLSPPSVRQGFGSTDRSRKNADSIYVYVRPKIAKRSQCVCVYALNEVSKQQQPIYRRSMC
ncbi:hypothetical protein RB195_017356 [Necator americanus]|uniref:Uncharacterized protein n=1 Tax=Necator americanus TaxID=51031 RepID=A0ABR1C790_NECAM